MSTAWIRVAYGLVLGVVLAATAGFGVLVFESGPKPPQPIGLTFSQLNGTPTQAESDQIQRKIDGFYSDNQTYREKYPDHQRNIFIWFAGVGLVLAAIGVALPAIVNYLRLSFVLGGLILIVTGTWFALRAVPQVAPASAASLLSLLPSGEPSTLDTAGRFIRFAVVLVGMLILVFIGLWRLTEWPEAAPVTRRDTSDATTPAAPASGGPPLSEATTTRLATAAPPEDRTKWARPEEQPLSPAVSSIPAGESGPATATAAETVPTSAADSRINDEAPPAAGDTPPASPATVGPEASTDAAGEPSRPVAD